MTDLDIPSNHSAFTKPSAGYGGAAWSLLTGKEPYIWIVNSHTEAITIVVSKFKPNRIIAGMGANGGPGGGWVDIQSDASTP
ncbi:hypothetical protein EJ02DRAFT_432620 [Clathrospora elynae]|uniref:Uncharacterized protein n=1 Tax=Clathrospora elynae TaxID=706981 RepID=A0A6A5SV22_9PLEO|nr:hypothetical protein EJ02DRAFT_432620 [Clathrospora elynae]